MNNVGNEAKDYYKYQKSQRSPLQSLIEAFVTIVGYIAKALAIFIGIIFMIVGLVIIIPLTLSLFGLTSISYFHNSSMFTLNDFGSYVFTNNSSLSLAIFGVLLFVGIPLLMLILSGIKLVFGLKFKSKVISITALSLWLLGLILCVFVSVSTVNEYKEKISYKQSVTITQPKNNILYIDVPRNTDVNDLKDDSKNVLDFDNYILNKKDDELFAYGIPQLKIVKSDSNTFEIDIIKSSRGSSTKDAKERAQRITYKISQKDSVLSLENCFYMNKNEKWRHQRIKLVLKVPVGKAIIFNRNVESLTCFDGNVEGFLCSNVENKKIIMTENGLKCPDCKEEIIDELHHRKNW